MSVPPSKLEWMKAGLEEKSAQYPRVSSQDDIVSNENPKAQHAAPTPKAHIETFSEGTDGQCTWDARGLEDDEILPCFRRCLHEVRTSSPGASPMLQIIFVDIDLEVELRRHRGNKTQRPKSRRTIWIQALQLLSAPKSSFKDAVTFASFPPRLSSQNSRLPSLSNIHIYRVTAGAFDMIWAYGKDSQAIVGLFAHSGAQSERICNAFREDLFAHRTLVKHPMLLALLAHFHIVPEMESWLDIHIGRVIDATIDTGFHHDLAITGRPQLSEIDLGERSAKVSGVAANLATNHLWSEGLLELATFIQHECGRLALEQSNNSSAGFLQSNRYVVQHAECCALRSTAHRNEAASWQKKANIQVQGIFNLIAQRDQTQNIKIADASRALAEATKRDSTSMKALAVVTMCFLPGTFLASLFAVPFFEWNAASGNDVVKDRIWVYWAFSIPITFLILTSFILWDRHVNKKDPRLVNKTLPLKETPQGTVATSARLFKTAISSKYTYAERKPP